MHDHDDPEKCNHCRGILADLSALEKLLAAHPTPIETALQKACEAPR